MILIYIKTENEILRDYPDVMTIGDLQKALQISKSTAYGLIHDGIIQGFKIGTSIKIPKLHVIDFIMKNQYNKINQ